MTTDINGMLAGATEFVHCCKILPQAEIAVRFVACQKRFGDHMCREGDLYTFAMNLALVSADRQMLMKPLYQITYYI